MPEIEFEKLPFEPLKTVASDWKPDLGFVCRACGDAARMHPQTNFIWGCLTCGMTTAAVGAYFKPRAE
jgi:ribosomal protein L37AE/L43A